MFWTSNKDLTVIMKSFTWLCHFEHISVENHPVMTFFHGKALYLGKNEHQNNGMFHRFDILKHDWCFLRGSNWSRATRIRQNVRHVFGIPAMTSRFCKNQSYKVLNPDLRYAAEV